MISKSFKGFSSNRPSPSFPKGIIIKNAVRFIENTLVDFQEEYVNELGDSEERISQFLVNWLVDSARIKGEVFIVQREVLQEQERGNDRRVDIGVFMHRYDRSPFFTVEAKRLPTPGADREREYVMGNKSGGIERYKLGLHGADNEKSAIVGYVEKEQLDFWAEKINNWIDDLIAAEQDENISWSQDDKLVDKHELSPKKVNRFQARHSRKNKNPIHLFHYLFIVKTKKK